MAQPMEIGLQQDAIKLKNTDRKKAPLCGAFLTLLAEGPAFLLVHLDAYRPINPFINEAFVILKINICFFLL